MNKCLLSLLVCSVYYSKIKDQFYPINAILKHTSPTCCFSKIVSRVLSALKIAVKDLIHHPPPPGEFQGGTFQQCLQLLCNKVTNAKVSLTIIIIPSITIVFQLNWNAIAIVKMTSKVTPTGRREEQLCGVKCHDGSVSKQKVEG